MITGGQLRAARSLLGWNQDALAENSGVAVSTVRRMEAGLGPVRGYSENVWSVQRALEEAGIQFIDQDDSGGAGVRFREGN
jgi:transcriptional regulator with XRE-family HTH domain